MPVEFIVYGIYVSLIRIPEAPENKKNGGGPFHDRAISSTRK